MNIGLDIWFVAGFKMGVAGAAWATIISQAVSGILCLVRLLLMRDVLHITWRTLWPTKALLFQLIRLGLLDFKRINPAFLGIEIDDINFTSDQL